jgi:hypothetical protein
MNSKLLRHYNRPVADNFAAVARGFVTAFFASAFFERSVSDPTGNANICAHMKSEDLPVLVLSFPASSLRERINALLGSWRGFCLRVGIRLVGQPRDRESITNDECGYRRKVRKECQEKDSENGVCCVRWQKEWGWPAG